MFAVESAGRYLFTSPEKMLGAWLSHPSHVCCGLLGSVSVLWLWGRKGKAFIACSLWSLRLHFCSWERGSSCRVTSLLQCLWIMNACQLVGGCQWEGSPDSAVQAHVLTAEGCWSIFSPQVEYEVVSELHNGHMINGRLGILGMPWRSGQLGQHFLI